MAVAQALRDRWNAFDMASLIVGRAGIPRRRTATANSSYSRNLAFSGAGACRRLRILARIVFGSAYADMRLVPYLWRCCCWRSASGASPTEAGPIIAVIALLFCPVRLGANTFSLASPPDDQQAKLQAIDTCPDGRAGAVACRPAAATVAAAAQQPSRRDGHCPPHGFSNDQWRSRALNLLDSNIRRARLFRGRPVADGPARPLPRPPASHDRPVAGAFPRDEFDYVWLIDVPRLRPGAGRRHAPVWRGPTVLYRIAP